MAGSDLVKAARGWLGVPFRHQGRSEYGVDCVGLLVCAFRDIGICLTDFASYPREPFNGELEKHGFVDFEKVPKASPGDVFFMKFKGFPVSHVAIFTGETIIHSYSRVGRVVEQPFRNGRPAYSVHTMRYKAWLPQSPS